MELESQLQQLDPGSKRYHVLAAARDFRASWVRLGELLTRVREECLFEQWGYTSFEAYCRRELKLRRDTAAKLTRSYAFLRDHEPKTLDAPESERELPALDVVDLLSRAKERSNVSDDQLNEIKEEVFAPEGPSTRNQVVRRFRQLDPDAFRAASRDATGQNTAAAETPKPPVNIDLRKALLLAERLQSLLEPDPQASDQAKAGIATVVRELRERSEAGGGDGEQTHSRQRTAS